MKRTKLAMIVINRTTELTVLFLLSVLLSAAGCSAQNEDRLLGTWAYVTYLDGGGKIKRILKFESNGQWENSNFITPTKNSKEIFISESGTWVLDSSNLKMITKKSTVSFDPEEEATLRVLSLKTEELTLEYDESTEIYQRVGTKNGSSSKSSY